MSKVVFLFALLVALAAIADAQKKGAPVVQRLDNGAGDHITDKNSPKYAPLSTAMRSVLNLVVVYFVVDVVAYIFTLKGELTKVCKSVQKLAKQTTGLGPDDSTMGLVTGDEKDGEASEAGLSENAVFKKTQEALETVRSMIAAAGVVKDKIPMLCILIVFARLRAKVDLEGTEPSAAAKSAFSAVGYIILAQAASLMFKSCGSIGDTICIIVMGLGQAAVIVCVVIIILSIFNLTKQFPPPAF
jgi:hypothetical protein